MQRANAVPFGSVLAKIVLRRSLALALDGVPALAVTHQLGIPDVDGIQEATQEVTRHPVIDDLEIDPAPVTQPLDEASLGQQLQMPADARLALAQDARQVFDVELSAREQHEDAQAGRLGRRLQHRQHCAGLEQRGHRHPPTCPHNI